ncbi:hypothetical protein Tco_0925408 [Tanacetum coccineum]|uniref:Uncharacterized protein n=1 Tax=Tanacetum coccineum TaxID=301880 RepID=A0ABQ5DDT3_9ASTR
MASAAAKPCQGDSSEFYLITGRNPTVAAAGMRHKGVSMPVRRNLHDLIKGRPYPHDLSKPLPLFPDARGRQIIPYDHFLNNDLEYLKGGSSSRKYTTSITKTKAADYGHFKWIEDKIPRSTWSEIMEFFGYKHFEEIIVRRQDDVLYKFREGDFKRLRREDIEDMLLLLVQGKLTNLNVDERFALNVALRMYMRRIVIQEREELQLTVESYQKKINLTKPDTYRSDISKKTPYTTYHDIQGIIYQDDMDINRLIRTDKLHKFSDGTHNIDNSNQSQCYCLQTWDSNGVFAEEKMDKQDQAEEPGYDKAIDKKLNTGEHAEFDESNTHVLERFYTSAGNPVKEILLKLNLPDHRKLKDGGEVKEFQRSFRHSDTERLSRSDEVLKLKNFKKDATLKLFKSTNQERPVCGTFNDTSYDYDAPLDDSEAEDPPYCHAQRDSTYGRGHSDKKTTTIDNFMRTKQQPTFVDTKYWTQQMVYYFKERWENEDKNKKPTTYNIAVEEIIESTAQNDINMKRWKKCLDRKFIDIVVKLGGFQAATPEKIIQHMKEDDITILELQNHLHAFRQKTKIVDNFVRTKQEPTFVDTKDWTQQMVYYYKEWWEEEERYKIPIMDNGAKYTTWSTEMCKKFIDIVVKLGGSKDATPNRIKQQMKDDNVTLSEVQNHFKKFNGIFSFTSIRGKVDKTVNNGHGPWIYRMQGENYHLMPNLGIKVNDIPKFSQLYIFDNQNEIQNRFTALSSSSKNPTTKVEKQDLLIADKIKKILDDKNPLVKKFRMIGESIKENNACNVKLRLVEKRDKDVREYNLPTANEVAAIIIGDFDDTGRTKDIIVEGTSGVPQRISELHPSYLPLQYPLLFPYAEDGYRDKIFLKGKIIKTKNER